MTPALFALAVGPGLVLLHGIYVLDRYEKEPIRNLLKYLTIGAVACLFAGFAERVLDASGALRAIGAPLTHPFARAVLIFLCVGLVEEGLKILGLGLFARSDKNLNEPFDWIVYAVTVSLGFAILENFSYVLSTGAAAGVVRALTAVPSHALDGTIMGHRLALAARGGADARRQRLLALLEPAAWHGAYDFLALDAAAAAQRNLTERAGWTMLLWLGLLIAEWIVAAGRVRAIQAASAGKRIPPILYAHRILKGGRRRR